MPFTTPIVISPLMERPFRRTEWIVIKPLNFQSTKYKYENGKAKNYVVPAGTIVDLRSGLAPNAAAAAILHDYLYTRGIWFRQIENRLEADDILFEAEESTGVALAQCYWDYAWVRAMGWSRFNEERQVEI